MSTLTVTVAVVVTVIVVLIAPVYLGIYFSKKSIEKRRQTEAERKGMNRSQEETS